MERMEKRTAIDWLVEELETYHTHIDIKNTVAFDFAKIMEKGQIIEAYEIGESEWTDITYEDGNDYYNKTYNK
jgi:hypothetical protein